MAGVLADTHALVWYLFDQGRLSETALRALDETVQQGRPVLVSAISLVEVTYLVEKGRLPSVALDRITEQLDQPDAAMIVVPLDAKIVCTLRQVSRAEVPDMPDRIIAATALYLGVPLVSRDRRIRLSGVEVIW